MDKLKLHSPDLTAANIEKVGALFPNCLTEARDESGKLTRAIDFDQLRQELSGSLVEGPRERYHLDWPGKREALLAANAPIAKTLRPCREESVDFDTTRNLFIEGDNLDALKLLQETYLEKVKMIYIDPPYNTGGDFIYDDDFGQDSWVYFKRSNQNDEDDNRLVANTEANGRFHSDWLAMMYARIKLAKNLLSTDGLLMVSLNDVEIGNFKCICSEIFGDKNHLATFIWINEGNIDNQSRIKVNHEYVIVYAKNEALIPAPSVVDPNTPKGSKLFKDFIENTIVKNGPANPVSPIFLPVGFPADFPEGTIEPKENFWPQLSNAVKVKNGMTQDKVTATSGWSSKDIAEKFIQNGFKPVIDTKGQETVFYLSQTGALCCRKKRLDAQSHVLSVLRGMGTVQASSSKLAQLGISFSYPKPVELIEYLIKVGTSGDDIVMDFFAGAATTGEAVLNLNQNGGHRRYILVQLPADCNENSVSYKTGQKTIADLAKERMRGVGCRIKAANATTTPNLDIGFRVLKIDTSNMKDVYYAPESVKQADLIGHIDNIKEGRTPEDLLFQVLVDWCVDLSLPITQETIAKKKVFFVDGDALAACFDPEISEDLVKTLAQRKPLRAVFRDSSYGSDSVKINVKQIFKLFSPATELKSL
ncbi:MAG: site-specific DNA-methyltransferase [Verrucomicrobiota bacterium]